MMVCWERRSRRVSASSRSRFPRRTRTIRGAISPFSRWARTRSSWADGRAEGGSTDPEADSGGARDRTPAAVREHRPLCRPLRLDHGDGNRRGDPGGRARMAARELLAEGAGRRPRRRVRVNVRRLEPGDEGVVRALAEREPQAELLADERTIFLAAFEH